MVILAWALLCCHGYTSYSSFFDLTDGFKPELGAAAVQKLFSLAALDICLLNVKPPSNVVKNNPKTFLFQAD